ncbi:MAG TPA: hypothetical protein PKZ42_01800 [Syntrophales bacterium]|nr:hypothetical protein [Syntrophales bacterium]
MEQPKPRIPRFVVDILVMLMFAAYGWIFTSVCDNIDKNSARIDKVEDEVDDLYPTFTEIKERLAGMESTLEYLKNKK